MQVELEQPNHQITEEKVLILQGVTWEQFKAIAVQLQDHREVKLSYLNGVLEIMSPIGEQHEKIKSTLSLLLEAYMREKSIRFYKRGGFTLEAEGYASGTPDESYSIGQSGDVPDIVIEVIVTSGTLNRRKLYEPMRVPEVWFWRTDQLKVFQLQNETYEETSRSQFFPDLDLNLLLHYLAYPDQYDAVQEFEQVIRGDRQP
ncbi:Uma2 family endonuclease [Oscillatoria sp. FACHB-1407]|uniref:Uma2 family endonuclease n=1 Tax=Oscillatoria sp. FACHB-1407 TaxID=2692847 RepID=UPI00168766BC|nr:Uma2 family endonuclease [Oscillatoria sp. FACHB-1407]MBD2465622.1 Uma2 family endonuclease [Oscillatoria sp. FACHB-1407]